METNGNSLLEKRQRRSDEKLRLKILMHFRRSPRDISSNGNTFIRGGEREGNFHKEESGRLIVSTEGRILALFEPPWWRSIYTFFPSKEEGRRRDFTSVRSSKHRPSSSSRSRRRTKDDWAGRRAGCSLRLRVLLLSRNFLTREENFNNFSHSLFFSLEQKSVWWITFHNCVLDCSGNFRNDGSILSFVETYYSI